MGETVRAVSDGSPPLRDRYLNFVARHEVAWELTFAALAIAFVVIGYLTDDATGVAASFLGVLDVGLTGLFATEFISRVGASHDRTAYLRGHWIDLFALAPTTRALRILRVLRLLRLVRAFSGIARALSSLERFTKHRGFIYLLTAWVAVMGLCSLALYAAENGTNEAVSSPLDTLWWGVVTMTTVGYGDVYPITPEGRIAAGILMVLGIGLFSAVTATITSILVSSNQPSGLATELERLSALYAAGRLTEAEFITSKARIIGDK